jgi:hypothetical protein
MNTEIFEPTPRSEQMTFCRSRSRVREPVS